LKSRQAERAFIASPKARRFAHSITPKECVLGMTIKLSPHAAASAFAAGETVVYNHIR
jgi:hypothetical protein